MRFVKLRKDAINTIEKGKMDKLRSRQEAFLKTILSSVTYDLVQLDYSNNAGTHLSHKNYFHGEFSRKKGGNLHFLNKLDQIDCYLPLTTHFYILIFQFIIGV